MTKRISRRTFFECAAAGAGGLAMVQSQAQVPKRPMGRTGLEVSCMGLGGYHLGAIPEQSTIDGIVGSAIDAGVNFFDNAWEYHDGRSEEVAGRALKGKRDQVIVMTKVCTHGRDQRIAMRQLEESLRRLQTDHLDVWQIHEVVYWNDPDLIFAPNGAIEALAKAKQQGKTASSASPATKIHAFTRKCSITTSPSTPSKCRSTASMRLFAASNRPFCLN